MVTNEQFLVFVTFNFDLNLVFSMHHSICIQTHDPNFVYITKKGELFYLVYNSITDSNMD